MTFLGFVIIFISHVNDVISQRLIPYGNSYFETNNVFINPNSWGLCNNGYMLTGFYKNDTNELDSLIQLHCTRPPVTGFGTICSDISVVGVIPGYAECPLGTMIQGIYRGDGNILGSIERLRCCRYTKINSNTNIGQSEVEETTYDEFGRCLDQNRFHVTCVMPTPYYMTGLYLNWACAGGVHCIEYARITRLYIIPTQSPTNIPTLSPTETPTLPPSKSPTLSPSVSPTLSPTQTPTIFPTLYPTLTPSVLPSHSPTNTPTNTPSDTPTDLPTNLPSLNPTNVIESELVDVSTLNQFPPTKIIITIIGGVFICVIFILSCVFISIYMKRRKQYMRDSIGITSKDSQQNNTNIIEIKLPNTSTATIGEEPALALGCTQKSESNDNVYVVDIVHHQKQNSSNIINKQNQIEKDKIFKDMLASQNNDLQSINNELVTEMDNEMKLQSITKGFYEGNNNDDTNINIDSDKLDTAGEAKYQVRAMKNASYYF